MGRGSAQISNIYSVYEFHFIQRFIWKYRVLEKIFFKKISNCRNEIYECLSSINKFTLVPLTCLAPELFCTHRNISLKPVRITNKPPNQQPEGKPHGPSAKEPEPDRPKPEQEETKPQRKESSTNKHQPSPNDTLTGRTAASNKACNVDVIINTLSLRNNTRVRLQIHLH